MRPSPGTGAGSEIARVSGGPCWRRGPVRGYLERIIRTSKNGIMRTLSRVALLAVLVGGCVTRTVGTRDADGLGAALVVERFLRASNTIAQSRESGSDSLERMRQELDTMIRLFGTSKSTIEQLSSREAAERRMIALADLLRHDDYRIAGNRLVPGRGDEAVDIMVRMTVGTDGATIPFTVVRTSSDGWRIEKIQIEPLVNLGG